MNRALSAAFAAIFLLSLLPTRSFGAYPFLSVTSKYQTTCGVVPPSGLQCWGNNSNGQVGNGVMNNTPADISPVVGLSTGVAQAETGANHACARMTNGTLKCWGSNSFGQFGTGNTTSSNTPVAVPGLTGVTDLTIGARHTCVIAGGYAWCWGDNRSGQAGIGMVSTSVNTPTKLTSLGPVLQVKAGGTSTCALLTSGAVKCWGYNLYGTLGNGRDHEDVPRPTQVIGLTSGVASIAMGINHGCAVLAGGTMKCWGYNYHGEVGNGQTMVFAQSTPVAVNGITGAISAALSSSTSCALISGGALKCWGQNYYGTFGNGTNVDSVTPVTQPQTDHPWGYKQVSGGNNHFCAVENLSSGAGLCWGRNGNGQLGNDTTVDSWTPDQLP